MAPTRPLWWRMCAKKSPLSEEQAVSLVRRLTKRDGEPMNAYRCPYGWGHWHVGHATAPSGAGLSPAPPGAAKAEGNDP